MENTLVPIFVCAVMPISVILIYYLSSMNSDNKRAQVLMKAIETNKEVDTDNLAQALAKPKKTAREVLNTRLLRGCIFTLIGLVLIITGCVLWASGTEITADPVAVSLLFGGMTLAVGASYMIVYFVTRKQAEDSSCC